MTSDVASFTCELDEHDALRTILEGTATATGAGFFEVLVERLSAALCTKCAWVTETLADQRRLKTLAFCRDGALEPPFEIDIDGTPCQKIIDQAEFVHYPDNIRELFPSSRKLEELGAVSYMGVPLADPGGTVLGHLAVIDDRPMPHAPRNLALLHIFAARAAAELGRIRTQRALQDRERELQALVDSAMDGIVELDAGFRVVRLNPAARTALGLDDGQGIGMDFGSFLALPSREKLRELARRLDTFPPDRRFLWVPGGMQVQGEGGRSFTAEATASRFEMQGRRHLTLILRDVNDRLEAERQIDLLKQQTAYLREEIRTRDDLDVIVGDSPALQALLRSAAQVAPTDATVLIQGETGTGKEMIARFIHRHSPRAAGPFIQLNCAALQPTLVESELFGHEAGAFTGATHKREGRFELADGGTIFLDEVAEIPLELQAKLLRVLQEGRLERVGGTETRTVRVRVIAATNRQLNQDMVEGRFRADLFYRLNVYPIEVPPLRERREDIPQLTAHFVARLAPRIGRRIETLPESTLEALVAYHWPGNVRELKNVIERAIITSPGPSLVLREALDGAEPPPEADAPEAPFAPLAAVERRYVTRVLEATGWRISGPQGAATVLGLKPSTLRYRIQKLQIPRPWKT